MQKKLLAIAVAGALGAPALALAQTSTVQIQGRIYTEYSYGNQGKKDATSYYVKGDQFYNRDGSEIKVSGEEGLGGGLSAWFQCASTFDVKGTDPQGFCGRNSAIGLKGDFGSFFVGNWDTPFKRTQAINRIVNETGVFGTSILLFNYSTSLDGRARPGTWLRRQNSSIAYDSPTWNGFQLMLQTTTGASGLAATTGVPGAKARLYSLGARYDNGLLSLAGAYEEHRNFYSGGVYSGTDKGWHLNTGYKAGPVKLGALYTEQKFETSPTSELKHTGWSVAAEWNISGPHGLRAGYARANKTKGTGLADGTAVESYLYKAAGGTGANMWQVSYVHTLSKRTPLTGGYVRLNNDTNAVYNMWTLNKPFAGESQSAWAATLTHLF